MGNTKNENILTNPKKRFVYLDFLRIIAIFCIIFNHTATSGVFRYFTFLDTNNPIAQTLTVLFSAYIRIGVPLFFMVSGALILRKDDSYKTVLKRILRFLCVLIVFCTMRYLYDMYRNQSGFDFWDLLRKTTTGQIQTSYWFLYSYIGFLMISPILRRMAKSMETIEYVYLIAVYIFVWGILGILARTVVGQVSLSVPMAADTIVYPLAGYFIANRLPEHWNNRKSLLLAQGIGLLGVILSSLVVLYDHYLFKEWTEAGISLFVILPSLTTFYSIKYLCEHTTWPNWLNNLICTVGSCTFGVYLLEVYLKDFLGRYLIQAVRFLPYALENLAYMVLLIFVGCGITFIFKQIPLIRKLF